MEKPCLLDQARSVIRIRHYSRRTEDAYTYWIRQFILFHNKRHPIDMGAARSAPSSPGWWNSATSPRPPRTRRSTPSSFSTVTCCRSISAGWRG